MTANQKNLVRESFAQVLPNGEAVAEMFYGRLFEIDPRTRLLFGADMREQYPKLMLMLSVAVSSLDRMDEILPMVRALGRKHVNYGVTGEHYAAGGVALLSTLEKALGDAFTPEVREAWAMVYMALVSAMKDQGREMATRQAA